MMGVERNGIGGVSKRPGGILVTDFDGTMTREDFYRVALARLTPPEMPDYWEEYLAGRLTHFEALQQVFAHIHAPEDVVMATARAMELDPDLPAAVAHLQQAGWDIRIASAGCDWYIRRLLAEQGVSVTCYANPGRYNPAHGLQMSPPLDSPYYSPATGIDKGAVVLDAIKSGVRVAFAGDGRPDLPALLHVPPDCRFARGWLAEHCRLEAIPFHPFSRWSDIARHLLPSHV